MEGGSVVSEWKHPEIEVIVKKVLAYGAANVPLREWWGVCHPDANNGPPPHEQFDIYARTEDGRRMAEESCARRNAERLEYIRAKNADAKKESPPYSEGPVFLRAHGVNGPCMHSALPCWECKANRYRDQRDRAASMLREFVVWEFGYDTASGIKGLSYEALGEWKAAAEALLKEVAK